LLRKKNRALKALNRELNKEEESGAEQGLNKFEVGSS
jgi:hypothetical protein